MLKMNLSALSDRKSWEQLSIVTPTYNIEKMTAETRQAPIWVHFGAGNIFRGFIARLQNTLLCKGDAQCGIIAADTFDGEIIDKIYKPFDNLTMVVDLGADGSTGCEVVASVAEALRADSAADLERLRECFASPSLQMVSFTITEKGYALRNISGEYFPVVIDDIQKRPEHATHAMSIVCALMYHRYKTSAAPIALVSMDNCSHNGDKLRASIAEIAEAWFDNGFVDSGFLNYLSDGSRVSFPLSMIDKITPRPAEAIKAHLESIGVCDMSPITTEKGTFIAPFVNAEIPQYLVIEDDFPNGRPPLELAGVYMTDRETVNKADCMKVYTCLNPLHTALAVFGCLLGYDSIAAEMSDPSLYKLVYRIGYVEGMPMVTNPGIIDPAAFLDEVLHKRLPNAYIPDTPQRIACDTSQKIPVRFGETLKSYIAAGQSEVDKLVCIPLTIAGWLRYLLGIDDCLQPMPISADPMLPVLRQQLCGVEIGGNCVGKLNTVLSNKELFGVDLVECGLSSIIEVMLDQMLCGEGAVRATLERFVL